MEYNKAKPVDSGIITQWQSTSYYPINCTMFLSNYKKMAGLAVQVDFQRPVVISKIATQGAKRLFTSHYVLNYTIFYSTDRKRWSWYKGDSKTSKKASDSFSVQYISKILDL